MKSIESFTLNRRLPAVSLKNRSIKSEPGTPGGTEMNCEREAASSGRFVTFCPAATGTKMLPGGRPARRRGRPRTASCCRCADHAEAFAVVADEQVFAAVYGVHRHCLESIEWAGRCCVELVHSRQMVRDVDLGLVMQEQTDQVKGLYLPRMSRDWRLCCVSPYRRPGPSSGRSVLVSGGIDAIESPPRGVGP